MIDYSPFWSTMTKKHISQYRLLKCGIDPRTLVSLRHNRNITMYTLERLCQILDCNPNDVVAFSMEALTEPSR